MLITEASFPSASQGIELTQAKPRAYLSFVSIKQVQNIKLQAQLDFYF